MIKIYVSPYKKKNDEWSKKRIIWAAFHLPSDAYKYLDNLRKENPTWLIEAKGF